MKTRFWILLTVCILMCACLLAFAACDDGSNVPTGENSELDAEQESRDPCANGHTEAIDEGKLATCLEKGLTEGKHCAVCNTVLVAQTETAIADHSYKAWVETTPVTCEGKGIQIRSCSVCREKQIREIPSVGHSYSNWEVTTPAGCITKGEETRTCANCKDRQVKEVAATGHCWETWQETKASTETEKGERRRDCANCDAYETTEIDELAHDHSKWEVIPLAPLAPTCTESGLGEGKKCSGCGEILEEQEIIPERGHEADLTAVPTVHEPPTCGGEGADIWTCLICGDPVKTEVIVPTGHTRPAEYTKPTCTENGFYTCTACDKTQIEAATGHNVVIDTSKGINGTVAPTCTEAGYTAFQCTRCEYTEKQNITEKADHHWEVSERVSPTCTADGYVLQACTLCGTAQNKVTVPFENKSVYTEEDISLDHPNAMMLDVKREGNCEVLGLYRYLCPDCGAELSVEQEGTGMGHRMPAGAVVPQPTCTESAYLSYDCTKCSQHIEERFPALGHTYADHVCTKCGEHEA
ncbi:MAG: hypothetical protein IJW49_11325 [Clostridia bacterium]|nr:hypothetical protein [Clostridia bacterium]